MSLLTVLKDKYITIYAYHYDYKGIVARIVAQMAPLDSKRHE